MDTYLIGLLFVLAIVMMVFVRRFNTPPDIEKMRKNQDVKHLIDTLGYKTNNKNIDRDQIHRMAVDALTKIGSPAVQPLIDALKHSNPDVVYNAVKALGQIGDARAVEPLIPHAAQPNNLVHRLSAINSMGQISDKRAIKPLVSLLIDGNSYDVIGAIVEALDKCGWQPDKPEEKVACWIVKDEWKKIIKIGAPAVQPLMDYVDRSNWKVQFAIQALGDIKDARATDILIRSLSKGDLGIRRAAAQALGKIGSPGTVDWLIAALRDNDSSMRMDVATALGKMKDARAVDPLITLLEDRDGRVQNAASEALKSILPKGAVIGTKLYAYFIQSSGKDLGLSLFNNMIVLGTSDEEIKEKIRKDTHSPNAEVIIVPPEEWNPPKVDEASEQGLRAKNSQIVSQVQAHMAASNLPRMTAKELISRSNYVLNPVSGKLYFVVKITTVDSTSKKE